MYTQFYGFSEKPFHITPNPDYFYPSRTHSDALNHLLYALMERKGFVVITGEVGIGKTTLCRTLLRRLDDETRVACLTHSRVSPKQLIESILDDLQVPYRPGNKMRLLAQLNQFLLEQFAANQNVIVIFDEAQNLTPAVLEEIRLLSNLETNEQKLIQIILLGQPELSEKLSLKRLRQLGQRVTVHYHMGPLSEEEVERYIQFRLEKANGNGKQSVPIFTDEALKAIFKYSRGIPRLINALCDQALLTGYIDEKRQITGAIITEVADELPRFLNIRKRFHGLSQYCVIDPF